MLGNILLIFVVYEADLKFIFGFPTIDVGTIESVEGLVPLSWKNNWLA
jgi:hypothetical protein